MTRQKWLNKRYPLNFSCPQCGSSKTGHDTTHIGVCAPCMYSNVQENKHDLIGRDGINPSTGQLWRLSDPEIKIELKAELAAMKADPQKALQLLQDMGLLTATGRLPRRYGGR